MRPSHNILTLQYQFIHIYKTNYYKNTILFRNDNITEEAVYNEKNSKMSKRHSHGSSKKSSSKQHRHSSHKHRSQSESNNSNGVDALHVDHDQLGGAANNGSTSCRNFGSEIQIKKFAKPFFCLYLGYFSLAHLRLWSGKLEGLSRYLSN